MQMVSHLRSITDEEVQHKLQYVDSVRSRFSFASDFTEPPNAVHTLASTICGANQLTSQDPNFARRWM